MSGGFIRKYLRAIDEPQYTGMPSGYFHQNKDLQGMFSTTHAYERSGLSPMDFYSSQNLPPVRTFAGFMDQSGGLLAPGNFSNMAQQMSQGVPGSRFLNPGPAWGQPAPTAGQPQSIPGVRNPRGGLLG